MAERIALEGKLDLTNVKELHAKLLELGQSDITIDIEKVNHLGALGAQVLLAAASSARKAGRRFVLANASDKVLDQLNCMGLCPETIAGDRV